ncbi:hypothetical protein ASE12_05060 [Aeromicrobium sp. Root236]|nr:hypothetical protein ASE12_05060 [Aeromicrobium sp. Root236]
MLAMLLTAACTVTFNGRHDAGRTPHPTAPTDANGVEVWDLRTPPSAADVGMRADEKSVVYETDEPRRVRFLLPEGKELKTKIYLLIFQRIAHEDPADPTRPTGIDFDTRAMPLDTADGVMRDALTSFGLGTSAVDTWRTKIEERPKSGAEADFDIEGGGNTKIGYLSIGVGGNFDPVDGHNSAHITYHVNLY